MIKLLTVTVFMFLMVISSCSIQARESYHNCEYPEQQNNLYALSCNIYHESRGQSLAGQWAVAYTTMNRVSSDRFPNNVVDVVYQPYQFSWHTDGKSDRVYDLKAWMVAIHSATIILQVSSLDYPYMDFTEGSLFYHNDKVYPAWADKDNLVVTIDNHLFYKIDKKK